ncbi:MAG: succinate dehydrogenase cytochrome b subunit [Flavobacteriales bacterium]|nr:succinate dehydrogenase cytochrome b subunit [Flavobacteriales bacterium]
MSKSVLLKSSLAKKYWMGATGLFLCLFLVGHLAGNLQLLISPANGARDQFNLYGQFMTTNPLVKVLSYVTYISILFHAIDGLLLAMQNRKSRPVRYQKVDANANSSWASRNMAFLGTVMLVFIVLHMLAFWKRMHWGPIDTYTGPHGEQLKDLYSITIQAFKDPEMGMAVCMVYLVAMMAIMFHLLHGFQSAFQSLGLRHAKYTPVIKMVGLGFAVFIPALFAFIPFYVRFIL